MVEIEEDVSILIENDNFLFDEQVIQDERLFSLEQTSLGILEELIVIDDEFETVDNDLEGELFCAFDMYVRACFNLSR